MSQTMHSHRIIKCRCGSIIAQCRCFDPNKVVEIVDSCDRCDKNIRKVPSSEAKQDQYNRVHKQVAAEIESVRVSHGMQAVALATVSRLVEARMNTEDLVKALTDLYAAERNKIVMENMPRWDDDSAMGHAEQLLSKFGVKFPNEIHHV